MYIRWYMIRDLEKALKLENYSGDVCHREFLTTSCWCASSLGFGQSKLHLEKRTKRQLVGRLSSWHADRYF